MIGDISIFVLGVAIGLALAYFMAVHHLAVKKRTAEHIPEVLWSVSNAEEGDAELCIAAEVDTSNGFWEFYDTDETMVLMYEPRAGDTLVHRPLG